MKILTLPFNFMILTFYIKLEHSLVLFCVITFSLCKCNLPDQDHVDNRTFVGTNQQTTHTHLYIGAQEAIQLKSLI